MTVYKLCLDTLPRYGGRSIPISLSVCLRMCLSVREHISGTPGPIGIKFCVQMPCGRGSVFFWRRCATLCTSGLWVTSPMTVMCRMAMSGRPERLLAVSYVRDRGGVWCLWMLVIIIISSIYTVNRKIHQNVFWYTAYKTWPIVIKYGTHCPE